MGRMGVYRYGSQRDSCSRSNIVYTIVGGLIGAGILVATILPGEAAVTCGMLNWSSVSD